MNLNEKDLNKFLELFDKDFKKEFVKQIFFTGLISQNEFNLPFSFIISNAINESNWGRSTLAVKYKNLFGIKYSALKNVLPEECIFEKVEITACDGKDYYCVFPSFSSSVYSLCYYIKNRKYSSGNLVYKKALEKVYDVKEFCNILGDIYAPNAKEVNGKTKGEMLIDIIKTYNLYLYDTSNFVFRK